jgi:hypothetical protein
MWIFAAVSLCFSGWMGWVIYQSLRAEMPSGWRDCTLTGLICCGTASSVVTSAAALLGAL